MIWTVTFRDKAGKRTTQEFEAETRAALFRELQQRDIAAIHVIAGKSQSEFKQQSKIRYISYGILSASLILFLIIMICSLQKDTSYEGETEVKYKSFKSLRKNIQKNTNVTEYIINNNEDIVPYWDLNEIHTNKLSEAQLRKWRNVRRPKAEPIVLNRPKAKYEIFKYRSENMIAGLLCAKPGQGFIGTPNYKDIDKDFLDSCKHPIIITDDDDAYSVALKQDMIEAKVAIKKQLDSGLRLSDLIQSAREEMRKLSSYRHIASTAIRDMEKSGEPAENVVDFVNEVNKILESKGIEPLKPNPLTSIRLRNIKRSQSE